MTAVSRICLTCYPVLARKLVLAFRRKSIKRSKVPPPRSALQSAHLGPWNASLPGVLNVIRKDAWPFCRTSSGVRLCWELEQPQGPTIILARRSRLVWTV